MKKGSYILLKILLIAVIFFTLRSAIAGISHPDSFAQRIDPPSNILIPIMHATSIMVAATSVVILFRVYWAVWAMLGLGTWSLLLLAVSHARIEDLLTVILSTAGVVILSILNRSKFRGVSPV